MSQTNCGIKEDKISMKTFNFIDLVIKVDEEIEIFLVEFELSNLGKLYHIEEDKVIC